MMKEIERVAETRFEWEGRPTSMLEQVGLAAGVSGGSIPRAALVAAPEFQDLRRAVTSGR